jgi:hypothetical protein
MRITSEIQHSLPRIGGSRGGNDGNPTWREGHLPVTRPVHDLLEISHEGRQLSAGAIVHHEAHRFDSLPQRPAGAPDDYIHMEDLMKRFDSEAYDAFQEAMKDHPAAGLSILLKFAKRIPSHPEWIETYRKENMSRVQ